MISDTDVKTIINAALKKDFPLSSERLLQLVNSDFSTYELLWTLFAILSILLEPFPKERMLSFCAN